MENRRFPIKLDHLSVSNSGKVILDNITLSFVEGINVLYGPRGSGKSTLLRSVVKLNNEIFDELVEDGTVYLFGEDVRDLEDTYVRRKALYLDTSFIDAMNHYNFDEFLSLSLKRKVALDEFSAKLDDLGILKKLFMGQKTPLSFFSPAEKISLLLFILEQKKPEIILMDCLLDHLDDENLERIIETFLDMKKDRTFVISTRILQRFLYIADLLVILNSGRINYAGSPRDFVLKL
ncbi:ATP-binding cassette domain-containing protein [Thermotoga sp. KOL6]|uniref:ATP-binding cassette domain-containing protein n=1 Tax=Thermotoga sp. KOL6 TaxID=126741 RepID=UPI000C763675|nr:ATP-binding cassette domain-containing protein [Thermotoga sp. KOL6]PLV58312.1 ABC transporter ATP-binding protein [Thermotoga sp. KOL6]